MPKGLYRTLLHKLRDGLMLIAALALAFQPACVYALPLDGVVSGGAAVIDTSGNTTTITQSSSRAIIDWGSFDVSHGESVQFAQPDASAITFNRINDSKASLVDGSLTANGNVWFSNSHGMVFGNNASINVGGLIATTANMSNGDFMAGNFVFDIPGASDSAIVNRGTITVRDGGLAAFVAPRVQNTGVINARLGRVELASGDSFTIDPYGDGLINLAVSPAVQAQLVEHTGTINADGGFVHLTAAAANDTVNSLINMDGLITADTLGTQHGEVQLLAKNGTTHVTGTITTRGAHANETGGTIDVLGKNAVLEGATLNASGDAGGGTIRIGGDYQGHGTTPTAEMTLVDANTHIYANALNTGDGGRVIVWANNATGFYGSIEAKGGAQSGNGGFIETSGKRYLDARGEIDTTAAHGVTGTWLLDPTDITISNAADTGTMVWTGTQFNDVTTSSSNLNVTTLQNRLATTNVIVTTASGLGGTGDITVSNALTWSAANSLTLLADDDINVNANITYTGAGDTALTLRANNNITTTGILQATGAGKLDITLNSDRDADSSGYINVGGNITSNGGNITLGGGSGAITAGTLNADGTINTAATGFAIGNAGQAAGIMIYNGIVNAGSGNIIANGMGYNAATDGNIGVRVTGASGALTGTGATSVSGVGKGITNSSSNVGVQVDAGGIISGAAGTTVIGTGGGAGAGLSNHGVYITGSNSSIQTTGAGAVMVEGTGGLSAGPAPGNNPTNGNNGVLVSANLRSTGSGNVIVNGTSVGTDSGNNGVFVVSAGGTFGIIGSYGSGNITVTGSGSAAATGNFNDGVHLGGAGGNAGYITGALNQNVTVNGTPGGGSWGVLVGRATISTIGTGTLNVTTPTLYVGQNGLISTADGDLTTTTTSYTQLDHGAIRSTGAGNIWVNGTTTGNSSAVLINDSDSIGIEATGTGNITVTGTNNNNAGTFGYNGILVNRGSIRAVNNITLNGTGGGTTGVSSGIIIYNGSSFVQTTGAGTITLNGVAGAQGGNGPSYGVDLRLANSVLTTGTGNIVVNTDRISLNQLRNINSVGTVTIAPYSQNGTVGIGGATGTLNLSGPYLSYIDATTLTIGRADGTGLMRMAGYDASARNWNLALLNGSGNIQFDGSVSASPSAWTMAANKFFSATNTSGDILSSAVGSIITSGTGAINLTAGNDINFAHDFDLTSATGAVTLRANRNIIESANGDITTNGGAITLNSDRDANSSGYINVGGNITSNGGNITLGGGSGAITAGTLNADGTINTAATGFAVGNAGQASGVLITRTISGGAGNVIINGQGYNNAGGSGNTGVTITNYNTGGQVNSTSGAISISGTGAAGTDTNYGIFMAGWGTTGIQTASGAVTLTGISGGAANAAGYWSSWIQALSTGSGAVGDIRIYGGGTSSWGLNVSGNDTISTADANIVLYGTTTSTANFIDIYGLREGGGALIRSTGAGNITMTGIANATASTNNNGYSTQGVGVSATVSANTGNINITGTAGTTGNANYSVDISGATITSPGSSNITITGVTGAGTNIGINDWVFGGFTLGGASHTGNITLNSNTLTIGSSSTIRTTGTVAIAPYSANGTVGIAGATGTLGVSSTYLGYIQAGTLQIGRADGTGLMRMAGYDASARNWNLSLLNGSGNIQFDGSVSASPSAWTMAANKTFSATNTSGNILSSALGSIITSGTGTITLNAGNDIDVTSTNGFDFTSATGTIRLNANRHIVFNSAGGHLLTAGGDVIFNSDRDQATVAGGAIYNNGGFSINTNGGNITMGGGADPAVGYAQGFGAYTAGVQTSVLNAGGGNIHILGQGASGAAGVMNTTITNSGTGDVYVSGIGGTGNAQGVRDLTATHSGTGTITVVGVGSGTGEGISNNNTTISNTATGTGGIINITGTGGATGKGVSFGFLGGVTSGANNTQINITGIGNGGENGIYTGGSGSPVNFGGSSYTGDITFTTDNLRFANTPTVQTTGTVALKQYTAGTTVGIGGATGSLYISSAILDAITAGTLQIGRADGTGLMRVAGYDANARNWNLALLNGSGDIQFDGSVAASPSAFTLSANKTFSASNSGSTGSITSSANGSIVTSGTGYITLDAGNDITFANDFDVTTFTGVVTLKANRNIIFSGGGDIVTNGGNVVFNSDRDQLSVAGGGIGLLSGSDITTAGGSLTMGGGADPTTGYALGVTAATDFFGSGGFSGIGINSTINTGSGNIIMHGRGSATGSVSDGIAMRGGHIITTTGNISLTGIAGNGGNFNTGVYVADAGASVTTQSGAITLTGTGSGTNAGYGVQIDNTVTSTGTGAGLGDITIIGNGATNAGNDNHGIYYLRAGILTSAGANIILTGTGGSGISQGIQIEDSRVLTTTSGSLTLNGIAGAGGSSYGILTNSAVSFGNGSQSGNITVASDKLSLNSSTTFQTTGTVTLAPYTANTTVGIGGATGSLGITSAILDSITASTLTIGRADGTGLMRVAGYDASARNWNLALLNGSGNIQFDGDITMAANKSLSTAATTGSALTSTNVTLATSGTGSISIDDPLSLGGNFSATSANGSIALNGTVNSANATRRDVTLATTGGGVTLGGAMGAINPLGAVSITAQNALALPAVNATSLLARTTGTTSDITTNGALSASGAGNAIVLASGNNFINNVGAGLMNMTGGGRWLVYSQHPNLDSINGLSSAFTRYNSTYAGYGPGSVIESGNGFLYALALGTVSAPPAPLPTLAMLHTLANGARIYTFLPGSLQVNKQQPLFTTRTNLTPFYGMPTPLNSIPTSSWTVQYTAATPNHVDILPQSGRLRMEGEPQTMRRRDKFDSGKQKARH